MFNNPIAWRCSAFRLNPGLRFLKVKCFLFYSEAAVCWMVKSVCGQAFLARLIHVLSDTPVCWLITRGQANVKTLVPNDCSVQIYKSCRLRAFDTAWRGLSVHFFISNSSWGFFNSNKQRLRLWQNQKSILKINANFNPNETPPLLIPILWERIAGCQSMVWNKYNNNNNSSHNNTHNTLYK